MTDYSLIENELIHIFHCDTEKLEEYEPYINHSAVCISAILKDIHSENDSRIVRLCAAKAYYQIVLAETDDDITAFKAGDISYTRASTSAAKAKALLDAAMKDCNDLVKSTNFSFTAV